MAHGLAAFLGAALNTDVSADVTPGGLAVEPEKLRSMRAAVPEGRTGDSGEEFGEPSTSIYNRQVGGKGLPRLWLTANRQSVLK